MNEAADHGCPGSASHCPRIRLAFVVKTIAPLNGRGGAERVLAEVTARLAGRGQDVTIVTFDRPEDSEVYDFDPRVKLIKLGIGLAHNRATLGETLRRVARLRKVVLGLRPDVAVGFMHSAYLLLGLALRLSGVKAIASEHIVYDYYRTRPMQRLLLLLGAPLFPAITTLSERVRRGYPASIRRRMVVIRNPVSPARLRADPKGGERKTLLTVGRLMDQKDHRTLIAAFALVAGDHPDWDLRIVGEGELRERLEAQADALGLSGRIALPGPARDVAHEYAGAQLFAISSKFESFGIATAEALAHGLPVVGFADCAGTTELVDHERNGLLVSGPDRVRALAQGLARAMGDARLRAGLAREAPSAMEPYEPEAVVSAWETLLYSVAGRRDRGVIQDR